MNIAFSKNQVTKDFTQGPHSSGPCGDWGTHEDPTMVEDTLYNMGAEIVGTYYTIHGGHESS